MRFRLRPLGHVPRHDAQRQPLDDGGLAHAGVADEHRVVLGAARQHLHHPADLLVPSDDRVELALGRQLGQVPSVAFQRLVGALRVLAGDALVAAHLLERAQQGVAADAVGLKHLACLASLFQDRQQQVLDADVVVLESSGLVLRPGEQARQPLGDVELLGPGRRPGSGHLRDAVELLLKALLHRRHRDVQLGQQRGDDAVGGLQQGGQQVLDVHPLVVAPGCHVLGLAQRFL